MKTAEQLASEYADSVELQNLENPEWDGLKGVFLWNATKNKKLEELTA